MRKGIRKWVLWPSVAMALFSGTCFAQAGGGSAEGKAAIVNGVEVTEAEVNRGMRALEQELMKEGQIASALLVPQLRRMVLDKLIEQELLYQQSRKLGMVPEDALVEERLKLIKRRFPDENAFEKSLGKTKMSESDLREQIRRGVAVQRLLERRLQEKRPLTEEEIRDYYDRHPDQFVEPEQVHVSHILISLSPKADTARKQAAREKLESVRERIANGEEFAALAREVSLCPSASKGGDLGYIGKGTMPKLLEETAFSMKPGEVRGPVETGMGYHLIRLHAVRPERTVPYEEVKQGIEQRLREESLKIEREQYMEELKANAQIRRFD